MLSISFVLIYVFRSSVCGGIGERWFDSPMKGKGLVV